MGNNFISVRITPIGDVISCSREAQCWKIGKCQIKGSYSGRCFVQVASNFKVYTRTGEIVQNKEPIWRRIYKFGEERES